jgi:uncharacterized protein
MDRLDFPCEFKLLDTENSTGTIEGYASMFNILDDGGDIVLPGAFKATLADWRKRKALPPMLWQHNSDNPIGVWTELAEDDKGLRCKGELVMDVPQANIARALMMRGAVKGLSIGFRTRDSDVDRQTGARQLKKVDLYEISAVTFPMLREAQVTNVKGDMLTLDERELEQALREEGFSNREAKISVRVFKEKVLREGARKEQGLREVGADVLMSMRKAIESLRA